MDYCCVTSPCNGSCVSHHSSLPLQNPSSWTEQKGGENFRINLFDYASGAARLFWNEHAKLMPNKDRLNTFKKIVESFTEDQDQISESAVPAKCMDDSDFVEWNVAWTKSKKSKGRADEIQIYKRAKREVEKDGGSDTLLTLTQERVTEFLDAKGLSDLHAGVTSVSASTMSFPRTAAEESAAPVTPDAGNRAHGSVDLSNIIPQERKRKAGPAGYTGERVIGEVVEPKRRKKAKKTRKSSDDEEEKLIEVEIQLKQEQLKRIKADKEIEKLKAQLQARQNGAGPTRPPPNQAKIYSDFARVTAERDRLLAENERLRNSKPPATNGRRASASDQAELRRLREELKTTKRERDTLKMRYDAMLQTPRGKGSQRK